MIPETRTYILRIKTELKRIREKEREREGKRTQKIEYDTLRSTETYKHCGERVSERWLSGSFCCDFLT